MRTYNVVRKNNLICCYKVDDRQSASPFIWLNKYVSHNQIIIVMEKNDANYTFKSWIVTNDS